METHYPAITNPAQAYESLWDDITKHFLTQTSPDLLSAAISAINTLSLNAALSTQNVKKLSELSDALFTSLRTALEDEDVAVLAMSADQLEAVQAILLRLVQLARSRDVVEMMEDEEGGQTSAWDICRAFVERGELGYGEEAKVSEKDWTWDARRAGKRSNTMAVWRRGL